MRSEEHPDVDDVERLGARQRMGSAAGKWLAVYCYNRINFIFIGWLKSGPMFNIRY